jgi:hypothetical protein
MHPGSRTARTALLAIATLALSTVAHAQHQHPAAGDSAHAMSMPGMAGMSMPGDVDAAMAESMAGMKSHPHMRMTALRVPDAADSARAMAIADTLRRSIEKYRDVKVAEADGYKLFAPKLKNPRVYHYTKKWAAVKAGFSFDPTTPTSILYKRNASGQLELIGAMYTAPLRSSEDDLNARIPLSIAQWHEHVNICVPKRGDDARWAEKRNGRMLFGPGGAIATKDDCDANNGRFHEHLFNWMVHVNVFAGQDLATVFGDHH